MSDANDNKLLSVKVYVKLDHNSPRILCVTNHLRNSELIDPIFRWNGPGGYLSSGKDLCSYMAPCTLRLFLLFTLKEACCLQR